MFRAGKRFTFDAAHRLPDLPRWHKCGRLHGHTYTVDVTIAGADLTPPGFVADFADLDPLGRHLSERFDHRNLNEVLDFPPTAERIAEHLWHWCQDNLTLPDGVRLHAVRVRETPKTWAEHRG